MYFFLRPRLFPGQKLQKRNFKNQGRRFFWVVVSFIVRRQQGNSNTLHRSYAEMHVSFVGFSSFSKSIFSISTCKSKSLLTSIYTNGLVTSQSTFRGKRGPSAVLEILII